MRLDLYEKYEIECDNIQQRAYNPCLKLKITEDATQETKMLTLHTTHQDNKVVTAFKTEKADLPPMFFFFFYYLNPSTLLCYLYSSSLHLTLFYQQNVIMCCTPLPAVAERDGTDLPCRRLLNLLTQCHFMGHSPTCYKEVSDKDKNLMHYIAAEHTVLET